MLSQHGHKGSSHHDCAIACASKGAPVLLETSDGKYYVLVPSEAKTSLPKDLISKMETQVTVTGTDYSKGGTNYLGVKSVK